MTLMIPLPFLYSVLIVVFIQIVLQIFKKPKKLPPGPWKLPLIGNLHQLSRKLLHRSLKELASKNGPIMYLELGKIPAVVISTRELAEQVLKKQGLNFAQRPEPSALKGMDSARKGIGFCPYNEVWRDLRKIYVMEVLSKKRVESLKDEREAAAMEFVESIFSGSGKPVNFSEKIYHLTYSLNYRLIFGNRSEICERLISLLREYASVISLLFYLDVFPSLSTFLLHAKRVKSRYRNLEQEIFSILEEMIEKYKAERRSVMQQIMGCNSSARNQILLIDSLLQLQESGEYRMTDATLTTIVKEIFFGGSESTATTLEWAMSELMKNPSIMQKTQAEVRRILKGKKEIDFADLEQLHYLKSIIKETLRMHPPNPVLVRECIKGCEIFGYEIPEKTQIIINTWALARDPNYWINPNQFQPERFLDSSISFRGFDFELLPFGAGRRMCPGITYADAIVELFLAQLLYHFDWKLANGKTAKELDMAGIAGAVEKRRDDLLLIASPAQFV